MAFVAVNNALLAFLLGRGDGGERAPEQVAGRMSGNEASVVAPRPDDSGAVQPSRRITRPREPVYVPPPAPVRRQQPSVQYAPMPLDGSAPVAETPDWSGADDSELPAEMQAPAAASSPAVTHNYGSLPYWSDLPLEFRSDLVLPHVDVHVYSNDPARRFILVDLEKYREGEARDNGLVIEMINEGSIQMNYRGTSFLVER